MTPAVNLHIMIERFSMLSDSAYFDPSFKDLSKTVASIATRILDNQDDYSEDKVRDMAEHMWRIMKFIQGSRVKDTPHEALFVLGKALSHWMSRKDVLISNAALHELAFFLDPVDIREYIPQIGEFKEKPIYQSLSELDLPRHSNIAQYFVPLYFMSSDILLTRNSIFQRNQWTSLRSEGRPMDFKRKCGKIITFLTAWNISRICLVPAIVDLRVLNPCRLLLRTSKQLLLTPQPRTE